MLDFSGSITCPIKLGGGSKPATFVFFGLNKQKDTD